MKVRMKWTVEEVINVPDDTNWNDLEDRSLEKTGIIENMLFEIPGNAHIIGYDLARVREEK